MKKLRPLRQEYLQHDGIFEIIIEAQQGSCIPGDDLLYIVVAGDIRENIKPVLADLLDRIKAEAVQREITGLISVCRLNSASFPTTGCRNHHVRNRPQEFIEKFVDIHPLPHIVTTLSRLIADSESTMKDFEEVIKMDPILVSRLLRLVNSPFYGLAQTVDSIGRAVAFLGMKNLHNLVVADALKSIFVAQRNQRRFFQKKVMAAQRRRLHLQQDGGRKNFRNQWRRCLPLRHSS